MRGRGGKRDLTTTTPHGRSDGFRKTTMRCGEGVSWPKLGIMHDRVQVGPHGSEQYRTSRKRAMRLTACKRRRAETARFVVRHTMWPPGSLPHDCADAAVLLEACLIVDSRRQGIATPRWSSYEITVGKGSPRAVRKHVPHVCAGLGGAVAVSFVYSLRVQPCLVDLLAFWGPSKVCLVIESQSGFHV